MALEKIPFNRTRTDEERATDKSRTLNVRLYPDDDQVLKELRELFDIRSEGRIIKMALRGYLKVLQRHWDSKDLKYLFKKERDRMSDYQ